MPVDTLDSPMPTAEPASGDAHEPCGSGDGCSDCPSSEIATLERHPIIRLIRTGFYNALECAFNAIGEPPASILVMGGCRQIDMARRLAFLLPYSKIFLLEPDAERHQRALDEIHCRFEFIHAPVEVLPFEAATFDLVLAHHLDEFINAPRLETMATVIGELERVAAKHLIVSRMGSGLWHAGGRYLPGARKALESLGCSAALPEGGMPRLAWSSRIQPVLSLSPFPWRMQLLRRVN